MISIGILTFNSPITLKNTLLSYKHHELLKCSDDVFCVIQPSEKSNEEVEICEKFGIKYFLEDTNGRMLGGMKRVFKEAKYDCVLWTENDFRIHTNKKKVKRIIEYSEKLIKSDVVKLINIRSLKNPGHPITTKSKYNNEMLNTTKLNYVLYYTKEPHLKFSDHIRKHNDKPKMYIMNSKNCGYSNNCFITSKEFFNDVIIRYSNDNEHIEPEIDKIWGSLDLSIGISDGFMTHVRMDGHKNCWCCHEDLGGEDSRPKCECCISDYIKNIEFITDENGNDISKFQTGNEWLKYI